MFGIKTCIYEVKKIKIKWNLLYWLGYEMKFFWYQFQKIGLLNYFYYELICSSEDLLESLIQMWRPNERAFDISGLMFPLQLDDV